MGSLASRDMSDSDELDLDRMNDFYFVEPDETYVASLLQRIVESGQLYFSTHRTRMERINTAPLPTIKDKPNLELLKKNSIYRSIKETSGYKSNNLKPNANWSVVHMLANREKGLNGTGGVGGNRHNVGLCASDRCKISNNYLPNSVEPLHNIDHKYYCGIYSKNGKYLLAAGQDQELRVFDATAPTYALINNIAAKDVAWSILDVDFSPCGEHFAYCTWSPCLHIAPVLGTSSDLQCLQLREGSAKFGVFSVKFSDCGKKLLAGANDGCIYMYNRELNRRTHRLTAGLRENSNGNVDVNAVGFLDENTNIIFAGMETGTIRIYDLRCMNDIDKNPDEVGIFVGHYGGVTYVDQKSDRRYLISNSKDQSIKLWDMRVFAKSGADRRANFARNSNSIYAWDYRWDDVPDKFYSNPAKMNDDVSVMTYRGHRLARTMSRAKFSPLETTGERYISVGCATGRLIIYDVLTGNIVRATKAHRDIIRDVTWHPTKNEIITTSWDASIKLHCYKERFGESTPEPIVLRRSRRLALQRVRRANAEI